MLKSNFVFARHPLLMMASFFADLDDVGKLELLLLTTFKAVGVAGATTLHPEVYFYRDYG